MVGWRERNNKSQPDARAQSGLPGRGLPLSTGIVGFTAEGLNHHKVLGGTGTGRHAAHLIIGAARLPRSLTMSSSWNRIRNMTRRALFERSGLLAAGGLLSGRRSVAAPAADELQLGSNLYESVGVTPIVNCKGTFTIITGSLTLPEVKRAMDEASRHYVHMDKLMNSLGARLAELPQAEWGIVTAGCAAALTHTTAACIAGTDPEKMQRLPNLEGLKNEVIIPLHSRNVYDHAVRMLGVKIVEVSSAQELESAINPKTAMIMIMASPRAESGPLSTEIICKIARAKNVPVIVDNHRNVFRASNLADVLGGQRAAFRAWRRHDHDHRGLRVNRRLQLLRGAYLDDFHAQHAHRVIVHVTRMQRNDDLILQAFKVRQSLHLLGVGARNAGRCGVGERRSTTGGDNAPFSLGQLRQARAQGIHQLVHVYVMARCFIHGALHLG